MGSATESTCCLTSLLSITRAYEVVPPIAVAAGGDAIRERDSFSLAYLRPDLRLIFLSHRFSADRWLGHGAVVGIKFRRRCRPSSRFDAENAHIDGIAFRRHEAIFADHAILFAASIDFACMQNERVIRFVYQYLLIYLIDTDILR